MTGSISIQADSSKAPSGGQSSTTTMRIREIDGLRFFAIAAVVAVHYRPPFSRAFAWMSAGWLGVDLFFVISGFLITSILLNMRRTPHPFRVFYWRRILRIFPPYYLVLFLLLPLSLRDVHRFVLDNRYLTLVFLSSIREHSLSILFQRIFSHVTLSCTPMKVDNHLFTDFYAGISIFWSLSIEELFYLGWAPIVLKYSKRTIVVAALTPLLLCPVARLLAFSCDLDAYFSFFFRLDSLMMGSCLAMLYAAVRRGVINETVFRRSLAGLLPVTFLLLVLLSLHDGLLRGIEVRTVRSFAVFGYSLSSLLFACIIGLCVSYGGSNVAWCRFLRCRPFVYVGTVSYMLYLVHIPVFVTLYRLSARFEHDHRPSVLLTGAIAACISLVLCSLSWKYFESPILRLKNRYFVEPPAVRVS